MTEFSPDPPVSQTSDAMRKREKDLADREAELAKRERDVRLQEERTKPNFPREFLCIKPVVHHDIEVEIPPARIGLMRNMLGAYYMQCGVLVYNVICAIAVVSTPNIEDKKNATGGWATHMGVSIVHLLGIPGAFMLWYWSTYTAVKKGTSGQYLQSLVGIAVAFFYNLFMMLGISGYGASGWLIALQIRDEKQGSVGFIMTMLCAVFFIGLIFFFAWAFKRVNRCKNEDKATSLAGVLASAI